jgi:tetratricopeptide (TPR) repeat protein
MHNDLAAYKISVLRLLALGLFFLLLPIAGGAEDTAVVSVDSVRKYRFLAKNARVNKEFDQALLYYREYFKYEIDEKKKQKSYFFYGDILYSKKDYPAAKEAFLAAVSLDSLHRNSNLRLYALYRSEDKADSAASALERVLLHKPTDHVKRRELADIYRRLGRTKEAVQHYEHLIGSGQDKVHADLLELLAVMFEDAGDTENALKWRRRLIAVQGEGGRKETLESMVDLQVEKGDLKSAVAGLEQLIKVDPGNSYAYCSRIGRLAESLGDQAGKIRAWEGMVKANPADLETVADLADWYISQDDDTQARAWIERGLEQNQAHGQLQLIKGDLLARGGDEEGALAAFKVAKADPSWENVAQQRIWQIRPPETEEEKLKRAFFGGDETSSESN